MHGCNIVYACYWSTMRFCYDKIGNTTIYNKASLTATELNLKGFLSKLQKTSSIIYYVDAVTQTVLVTVK